MSSEKSKNIYQRMSAVMKDVGYIQKGKVINNMYKGVCHDEVIAKLRPAFIEHGIVVLSSVQEHKDSGNRSECTMDVTLVNIDDPQDKVTVTTYGYGCDKQDKGPGKAMSYAVKYALLKSFSLETGDDPEFDNIDHKPVNLITNEQHIVLGDLLEEGAKMQEKSIDDYVAAALKAFKVGDVKDLNTKQADVWINGIKTKIKQNKEL